MKTPDQLKRDYRILSALNETFALRLQIFRKALEQITAYPVHSEPVGGALNMRDIAEKALKEAALTNENHLPELQTLERDQPEVPQRAL